jgi:hypothetical protein
VARRLGEGRGWLGADGTSETLAAPKTVDDVCAAWLDAERTRIALRPQEGEVGRRDDSIPSPPTGERTAAVKPAATRKNNGPDA